MRLIDVDALKKEHRMADRCEDCERNARDCQYVYGHTRMDICEMLDEAPTVEMPGWVCRKDRLPEKDGLYLTLTYADGAFWPQIGKWVGGEWLYCAYVHYWMAIPAVPEPPEEVGGDA